jgi:very-short-patch-repair endonuclease
MPDSENNYFYNEDLRNLSHNLRSRMTKAEACLWKFVLKSGKMKGYNFRRQRPVLNYIADFLCKELMLVIEVDGLTHDLPEVIRNDEVKQKELEQAGFTVLRFGNSIVLHHIDDVAMQIEFWIEERQNAGLVPPPNPRQRGTRAT